jgi:hypothetical protein
MSVLMSDLIKNIFITLFLAYPMYLSFPIRNSICLLEPMVHFHWLKFQISSYHKPHDE